MLMTVYEALVEPNRRQILDLLRERPRFVGELVDLLQISQPGVSKHLRVLRTAGLVRVRQEAQRRRYELRPEPLAEVDRWLAAYRDLLEERYSRLDELLVELQQQEVAVSQNNRAVVSLPSQNEILITRLFAAPRELVFRAHTDPLLIPRWWGPRDTTTIVDHMMEEGLQESYVRLDELFASQQAAAS